MINRLFRFKFRTVRNLFGTPTFWAKKYTVRIASNGVSTWLRRLDLNQRPSGYEIFKSRDIKVYTVPQTTYLCGFAALLILSNIIKLH